AAGASAPRRRAVRRAAEGQPHHDDAAGAEPRRRGDLPRERREESGGGARGPRRTARSESVSRAGDSAGERTSAMAPRWRGGIEAHSRGRALAGPAWKVGSGFSRTYIKKDT